MSAPSSESDYPRSDDAELRKLLLPARWLLEHLASGGRRLQALRVQVVYPVSHTQNSMVGPTLPASTPELRDWKRLAEPLDTNFI